MLKFTYKIINYIIFKISLIYGKLVTFILLRINNVKYDRNFISNGIPKIFKNDKSSFLIGKNVKINNTIKNNPIGRSFQCIFVIKKNAQLIIDDNTGMSGTTIVCSNSIKIGKNVKIGANTCIYDTDFHSLNFKERRNRENDIESTKSKSIVIGNDVFIGAHSTILKGVIIGNNSIIGACSVITKNIPENEVWAGNPAKFIKKINY